jgi:hypothetical protein
VKQGLFKGAKFGAHHDAGDGALRAPELLVGQRAIEVARVAQPGRLGQVVDRRLHLSQSGSSKRWDTVNSCHKLTQQKAGRLGQVVDRRLHLRGPRAAAAGIGT